MREKGFALATTLVLGVAILVMGIAGMFVSEMGFRSISSEQAWHRAEKAANAGLQTVSRNITAGSFNCGGNSNFTFNGANVQVQTLNYGGHCFLWARATIGNNTNVVKVAILSMGNPAGDFGTLTFRQIRNLNIGGSGAITSCDATCKTPAIVIGNGLNNFEPDPVPTCPNNPRGITALVNPVVVNEELPNRDLTSTVFDNINNRTELLNMLSNQFRVSFNNGRPNGIVGQAVTVTQRPGVPANNIPNQTYEVCNASCHEDVEAAGSTLNCKSEDGSMRLEFTWSGDRYNVVQYVEIEICGDPPCRPGRGGGRGLIVRRTPLFSCYNIDFGQNSSIEFEENFTGGNTIAGDSIKIEGNLTSATASVSGYPHSLSLIARNQLQDDDDSNNITVQNVNVFAQNIRIDDNGLRWEGGLLYSGGAGNENFNINLNSNSYLGSQTNPVLLITDNNMNIQMNGTASINGLVFATDANNNLSINGNGNFSLNGAIVSNSNRNNNVNINGNFSINFNRSVLENLRNKFGFLKPPPCSTSASVRMPFIQTKMTVY